MYKKLDKELKKLKEQMRVEFNRVDVMGFDSLNVINTKKVTQAMYDRLDKANKKAYLKVAKEIYPEADGAFIDLVLGSFCLVTGYLYDNEKDRKRLRLNEQILTAREFGDRDAFHESLRKAANLWWRQTETYGIISVDKANVEKLKKSGVKEVVWISQHDGRECGDCAARHGKVFKINEIPDKTHYGCRCYVVARETK